MWEKSRGNIILGSLRIDNAWGCLEFLSSCNANSFINQVCIMLCLNAVVYNDRKCEYNLRETKRL